MKKLFTLLLTFMFVNSLFSQGNMRTNKWRKSENDSLIKAQAMFEAKAYLLALPIFIKLMANHPSELYLKYVTGISGLARGDMHPKALEYLTEVYEKNKKAKDIEFDLARAYHFNYKFNEAVAMLELYKKKVTTPEAKAKADKLIDNCVYGSTLVASPTNVKIKNLGKNINTPFSEFMPLVTSDESMVFYTYSGENSVGGLQDVTLQPDTLGDYYEDVFYSTKANAIWTSAKPVEGLINSNATEVAIGVSNDGQKLFVFKDDGQNNGDIYLSKLIAGQWSVPEKLKGEINSPYWESNVSLSPDEKTLYFSSTRPGGFGGKDIYKATLQADSSWGEVQNLGLVINTSSDDDAPFIHPDGKTLFYSSSGFKTMGGSDLFMSVLNLNDSNWGEAKNLGYPINTPDDDASFVLNSSGTRGYLSIAKEDGMGLEDLYSVDMSPEVAKTIVTMVKGMTTLEDKPKQVQVMVEYADKNYGNFQSSQDKGKYLINLPVGRSYKVTYKLNGFPDQVKTIDTKATAEYTEITMNINFAKNRVDTVMISEDSILALGKIIKLTKEEEKRQNQEMAAKAKADKQKTESEKSIAESKPIVESKPAKTPSEPIAEEKTKPAPIAKQSSNEDNAAQRVGGASVQGLVFKVQIGAFKHYKKYKNSKFARLGSVDIETLDNGFTCVTIGSFKTLNEAVQFKKKVMLAGSDDAFITGNYNGKRMYVSELIKQGLLK